MSDMEVPLRAMSFAAVMLAFGTSLFLAYAPAAISRTAALRIHYGAAVAALVSGVLLLVIHAASMGGVRISQSGETLWTALRETTFGRVSALRLVMLVVLCVFARQPRFDTARILFAGVAIACFAWSGHAVGTRGYVHVSADALHLLAAGAWVGGLLPFALALARQSPAAAVALTIRFSRLGVLCVAALLASGIVNAWFLVGRPADLVDTTYGRLLSLKIGMFALMVAVAMVNRFRLAPRLPAAAAARGIALNAMIEVALGTSIIIVVASLGVMVPAAHIDAHMH